MNNLVKNYKNHNWDEVEAILINLNNIMKGLLFEKFNS
jgi:hypothetical protein